MNIRIHACVMAGFVALSSASALAAIDDKQAMAILTKSGCTVCHSVDKKIVGPSYAEVSKKHKGEKDAVAKLVKGIRDGAKGVYGQIPMPPVAVATLSDADAKAIVEWILTK